MKKIVLLSTVITLSINASEQASLKVDFSIKKHTNSPAKDALIAWVPYIAAREFIIDDLKVAWAVRQQNHEHVTLDVAMSHQQPREREYSALYKYLDTRIEQQQFELLIAQCELEQLKNNNTFDFEINAQREVIRQHRERLTTLFKTPITYTVTIPWNQEYKLHTNKKMDGNASTTETTVYLTPLKPE